VHYGQGYINAGKITIVQREGKINMPSAVLYIIMPNELRKLQNASGRFRKYDYGNVSKNIRMYNSTTPPDYQLEKITAPIALFSSENDWLATTKVKTQLKDVPFTKVEFDLIKFCRNLS